MGIAGGRHRQTQLKGFDELLGSRRNENETNKWGPQDSTGSRAHDSIQELGKNTEMKKNTKAPGEDRTRDLSLTKRTHYHYATEAEFA